MSLPSRRAAARTVRDEAVVPAAAAMERAELDEQAAAEARARYRNNGIAPMQAVPDVVAHLHADEELLAMRPTSQLEDCGSRDRDDGATTVGSLYLTSRRILQLGRARTSIELRSIDELALAGDRLLLTLRDGRGFALDLPEPRLFRVQVAAALRASRN